MKGLREKPLDSKARSLWQVTERHGADRQFAAISGHAVSASDDGRPSLVMEDYGDLGAVAGPSWAITSPALLDSMVRVQMLVAGPPFASFQANTT